MNLNMPYWWQHWLSTCCWLSFAGKSFHGKLSTNPKEVWIPEAIIFLLHQWTLQALPCSVLLVSIACYFLGLHLKLPWANSLLLRTVHVAKSGPGARLQVLQNSGSLVWLPRVKTLSEWDHSWRNQRKDKKHTECRNIQARAAVHWLAQCQAKQPMGSREFQAFSTVQESDPYCSTHYDLPEPLSNELVPIHWKKRILSRHISQPCTSFSLACIGRHWHASFYMAFKHFISFATNMAANSGCNRFRIMPDIISKLLRAAIWSCCAAQLESEQTPFCLTGSGFWSAALQKVGFRTCGFLPMSYFYLETN